MLGHIEHISSSNVGWAGAKGFWIVGRLMVFLRFEESGVGGAQLSPASDALELFWRLPLDQVLVEPSCRKRHKLSGPAAVRGVVNSDWTNER